VTTSTVQALILAAGKGTRLKSARAKVLHPVLGVPLLEHVLRAVRGAGAAPVTVVVGHQAEVVEQAFAGRDLRFVRQDPPLGTGHAVQSAREAFGSRDGTLLVVNGDLPLLRPETLLALLAAHRAHRPAATLLTVSLPEPGAYGRVLRDETGGVRAIIEAKDAGPDDLRVCEINAGIYAFEISPLLQVLDGLQPQNAQGEYYLTDVVGLLRAAGHAVGALCAADATEALGVNTQAELSQATLLLRRRALEALMAAGVSVEDPDSTIVGLDVVVEPDAEIRAHTVLEGRTIVRAGAVVGPFARLADAEIGAEARILDHCLLRECVVEAGASVGPFAHIRPESRVGPRAKVGNFVELKKTMVGAGSKVPHLSYVGDATLGEKVNVGAGTITCNYDGVNKHPTRIEDGAFIGSDTTLVAPLTVGAGAYIAAGSTITTDVPAGALGLGRARQTNKAGWVAERARRRAAPAPGAPGPPEQAVGGRAGRKD
jgi:bifunctional UDP-N-acetylglucosamine pyrophosphorylase/glucosamine-1-phosphate N-acetyltransferase